MEKESAEKATTEFEDSVTSEEQGSLAENEDKSIENPTEIKSETTSDTDEKQEEEVQLMKLLLIHKNLLRTYPKNQR